jgi:predicted dehydrogenase
MKAESFPAVSPLKGAIIGFGNVAARAHLPVWQENRHFSIPVVIEPLTERAVLAETMIPGARVYSGIEDFLSHERVDFVDICTPPSFHADFIIRACDAGMHVFCEKPLVTRAEDMVRVQRAAQEHNRVIFSVNNWKYAPLWRKIRQIVGKGLIGPIRAIDLSVLRTPNSGGGASDWRKSLQIAGGGILLDHGWHHLYLILSLIPESPIDISAKMESAGPRDTFLEETVDLFMRFPNAEAELHLTWRASCRSNVGLIRGEMGTILIHDNHIVVERAGTSPQRIDFSEPLSSGSHHPEWMRPVIEEFYCEVLGLSSRGVNLSEAGQCARLIDSAYRSCRQAPCLIQVEKTELGLKSRQHQPVV